MGLAAAHRPRPASEIRRRGFTVLEILLVMAVMAILMGVGIGYMQTLGAGSRTQQARAIVRETIYACKQSSTGGNTAIFELREDPNPEAPPGTLVVGAAVARAVLTHNFEDLDSVSSDYPLEISGRVEIEPNGHTGRCVRFEMGGLISFSRQSAFAVTEGVRIDVWLKPDSTSNTMTVVKADGVYEILLKKDAQTETYDVLVKLQLRGGARGERSPASEMEYTTKGGPIRPNRAWTHLQVSFHGWSPSIRIDGVEHAPKRLNRRRGPETRSSTAPLRLAVPAGGAVGLTLSDGERPYVGLMDTLVVGGVFRSSDVERVIHGLELISGDLPHSVFFRDGRLDRMEHSGTETLSFQDLLNEGDRIEFRIGLYGTVSDELISWGNP